MENIVTKQNWGTRKLFDNPILCKDPVSKTEWYHNEISIIDNNDNGRIIAQLYYQTNIENYIGWGHNNTIEKWEAKAKLIVAVPVLLEKLEKARLTISKLKNAMLAHSNCLEGSEFDVYTNSAEEVENEIEQLIKKVTE